MKKFLVLGLVIFALSSLSAAVMAPNEMKLGDARNFCKDQGGMRLATRDELQAWGGAGISGFFWSFDGRIINPKNGNEIHPAYSFYGATAWVRCVSD